MDEAMIKLITEDCKKSCKNSVLFSMLKDQTILITGGTGFMGKWLAEMISYINDKENFNIQLILLARDIKKFEKEMSHLADRPYIRLLRQDVRNVHDLPVEINYIIHAAGTPDNREHVSQPILTIETFYKGTQAILDAASRLPDLKKIVHISSHLVYGEWDSEDNISEKFSGKVGISSINNVYAESKRIAETLCLAYRNQFKLPISIVRPFAFVGPYHDLEKPWAINNFIRDGILGGAIRILGNGSTVRSYLYGSDMAYWILVTLLKGQIGEIYNLGSSEAVSLNDLAKKIQTMINPNLEILSKSSKENYTNLSRLVPDTTKIVKALNVEETYQINDSINRTIVWNQLKGINKNNITK
ncbi:NAD-dependent epimerase/dehydratase family protein [Pedobacter hiemivivus]|uniref:NAD-dependent epimerase/dehydratase family protein n=1 Tax=Pedobacter hiemivivus TaxID=2530454 RepID=A0A4R0N843_9SPHI|nr:NAD-dependent epimerase/dehydratase family protein [Pedobacter hiemivivus]TCC96240.1 NAD-dependent epimerase/dehydratase family protein [Pedobacter hiemivivus]